MIMEFSQSFKPSDFSEGTKSEATYMRFGSFAFFEVSLYNRGNKRIFENYQHQYAPVYMDGPTDFQFENVGVQPGEAPPKTILFAQGKPVINNIGSSFTGYGFTGPCSHNRTDYRVKVIPIIAAYGMMPCWELFNAVEGRRLQVWEVGSYLAFSGVASIAYTYPSALQD